MTYRPEGWSNPHGHRLTAKCDESKCTAIANNYPNKRAVCAWDLCEGHPCTAYVHTSDCPGCFFEAGATAMLEALSKRPCLYVPAGHFLTSISVVMPVNGKWVFIPNTEESK